MHFHRWKRREFITRRGGGVAAGGAGAAAGPPAHRVSRRRIENSKHARLQRVSPGHERARLLEKSRLLPAATDRTSANFVKAWLPSDIAAKPALPLPISDAVYHVNIEKRI